MVKILGLEIRRAAPATESKALQSPDSRGGNWFRILESFAGAWQRNIEVDLTTIHTHHAIFACETLIASDVAKLRVKLVKRGENNLWTETTSAAFSPVIRKPNHYQTRIQFFENWILSKLSSGNTYILKGRDNRNVVTALYVLDPARCRPMVSQETGDVFYELQTDSLAGLRDRLLVPASEIIHDRFNCLFHPLVGLSPIYASGLAATGGLSIQENSTRLFQNGARPGGILVAPGSIDPAHAKELKEYWDANFTGENAGKTAVVGDGLKYEKLAFAAEEAQLIEQLKWSAEMVCSTFHVPPYKIGVGAMPSYNNVQALNVEYYSQCLQILIESVEVLLDEGLNTGEDLGTEFDLTGLLRMDAATQIEVLTKASGAGLLKINEARNEISRPPIPGGDAAYLQQQNYSLEALAKRDAKEDPFAKAGAAAAAPREDPDDEPEEDDADAAAANDNARAAAFRAAFAKRLGELIHA